MVTPSDYLSDHPVFPNVKGITIVVVSAILAYILYSILPYPDQVNRGLALLFFVAVLWMTEAIHTSVTAIMIPVLAVLLHIQGADGKDMTVKAALENFANPTIYLFFGGFALATALQVQRLDRKIAVNLIRLAGGSMKIAVLLLFTVTAGLSMWISNTATAAMMLPLALGLLAQVDQEHDRHTFTFVLLGIAYSASIGGLGTLVGSPPNVIAAKALNLSFDDWLIYGLPFSTLMMPLMVLALWIIFKPKLNHELTATKDDVPWNISRIITLIIFVLTALSWIFSKQLSAWLGGIKSFDTIVALAATAAIGTTRVARWRQISDHTDWGILLLFGGGITLSTVLKNSGAALQLGQLVSGTFGNFSLIVILLIMASFVIFLTEFSSNTASAALLVPIFAGIASEMNLPVATLVMTIGLGVSLAFMMPVATPPNAIVMGSGLIKQKEMMKAGLVLNLLSIILLTAFVYLIWG